MVKSSAASPTKTSKGKRRGYVIKPKPTSIPSDGVPGYCVRGGEWDDVNWLAFGIGVLVGLTACLLQRGCQ